MVTPIPKGKEITIKPNAFRPISASATFANLFETLLLYIRDTNLINMHTNQFGYQKNYQVNMLTLSSTRAYNTLVHSNVE